MDKLNSLFMLLFFIVFYIDYMYWHKNIDKKF